MIEEKGYLIDSGYKGKISEEDTEKEMLFPTEEEYKEYIFELENQRNHDSL